MTNLPKPVKVKILDYIGTMLVRRAVRLAPHDTTMLRESITYWIEGNTVVVGTKGCDYADKMEYGCFFDENTKVMTNTGFKKIKDLTLNDKLWTGCEFKRIIQKEKIEVNYPIKKITIKTKNKKLILTDEHPIFSKNKGWIKAKDVKKNDILKVI